MSDASIPDMKTPALAAPCWNAVWIILACALAAGSATRVAAQPAVPAPSADDRWRLVGQSASMRLYYEPASISRQDDIRRVREVQDLDVADPDGVRSRVYLNEYDCRNQMHRLGQMQSFAGPMLGGQRRFEVKEMGYWRKIPAGSAFAQVYRRVCPNVELLPDAEPPTPIQRLFSKD